MQSAINRFQPGRSAANDGRLDGSIPYNTDSNDGIYNNIYIRDRRIQTMTWGGLVVPSDVMVTANCYRDATGQPRGFGPDNKLYHFDSSGNLVPSNVGSTFGIGGSTSGGDGLNLKQQDRDVP